MKKKDLTLDVQGYKLNIRSAGIVIHNGKFLAHKDVNSDYYALLGGRIEIGEDSKTCLKREIQEELGKDIDITGYISTIENFFSENGVQYHEIMFVHKMEFSDDEDRKIEETIKNVEGNDYLQYEWIDIDHIDDYKVVPKAIKNVLKSNNYPLHIVNND